MVAESASPPRAKPRLIPLLVLGEFVGTFIANFLTLAVIQGVSKLGSDAQIQSLMGQLNPLVEVPPALAKVIPGHPALAPQTLVGNYSGALAGNVVQPASPIVFPQSGLTLAVGIALAYAIALGVTPHRTLNPTFTIAMALFGVRKWLHVIPCIVAQICGGLFACFLMWTFTSHINQCMPDATGAIACGQLPKTMQTAGLWGVGFPPADPFTWRPGGKEVIDNMEIEIGWLFWTNIVLNAMMVIAIIPLFAGKNKIPDVAVPLLIALIIVPFVIAGTPFGVNYNGGLFFSGIIYCSIAGWPSQIWSHANCYSVVVFFTPLVGAALGVAVLKLLHWLTSEDGPLHEKADTVPTQVGRSLDTLL